MERGRQNSQALLLGKEDILFINPRLTDEERKPIETINEEIAHGKLSPDSAKFVLWHRHTLTIDPRSRLKVTVRKALSEHYGIPFIENPLDYKFDDDLQAAIDLEAFGVDPHQAVEEYLGVNWEEELRKYDPFYKGYVRFGFSDFVNTAKQAIIAPEFQRLIREAHQRADRIKNMTPEEWERFNQGIRYVQDIYAEDERRDALAHIAQHEWVITSQAFLPTYYEEQKDHLRRFQERFFDFETTKALAQNSQFRFPERPDKRSILLNFGDLQPKQKMGIEYFLIPNTKTV